ncbi:uncharacterized protein LOC121749440 [Salvia splendens]|uniref:uncharacterized protein LOC121749440 n=1 Tax=Salvia splendens TaxID=180675 RepID=UPI001C255035|nr:uncharacterized protein LOC121749440 [Salvia splendens]
MALWKMKMRAVLVQQGLAAVLTSTDSDEKGKALALDEKAQAKFDEMQLKAYSAVILCLGDKVLREVQGETTASGILKRLDEVYLAKSLANRLYMKRRLHSYSFSEDKSIVEQDKDITLNEVHDALMAKELQKGNSKLSDSQPESLNIKKFNKKKLKEKVEETKHEGSEVKETRSCYCSDGEEAAEVINVMDKIDKDSWIMDSGCSFHMCPNLDWFQDLVECGGSVLLGNDNTCSIKGIGGIKLRMNDGPVRILSDVCKGQEVKMVAKRAGSLYYLLATVIVGESHATMKNDLKSWHLKLGHPAEGTLKAMVQKKVIEMRD